MTIPPPRPQKVCRKNPFYNLLAKKAAQSFFDPPGGVGIEKTPRARMVWCFTKYSFLNVAPAQWPSNVTSMTNMFTGAESFNQPLNKWNVSNVRYGALELELKFGVHVRYISQPAAQQLERVQRGRYENYV